MNNNKTTINAQEIAKFSSLSFDWWNKDGALKTLHDINPTRLEFINQYCSLKDKRVLDVGCGGGILSESLAAKGALVTGIDAEKEAIQVANAHALENQLDIHYLCTPIEDYEAPLFDVIISMELLEHVDEPELIIDHCFRLLKPGGFLFLSTINRTLKAYMSAVIAAEYIFRLLPKQTHDYNKFIKPAELAAIARRTGFEVVGLRGMAYNPLSRAACLQDSVSVNFLMSFFKS
jgi:2-polyprenyl-6-hydroxyphenyl methylase / 3-demethylubiquinone-9 3-methyltransferase